MSSLMSLVPNLHHFTPHNWTRLPCLLKVTRILFPIQLVDLHPLLAMRLLAAADDARGRAVRPRAGHLGRGDMEPRERLERTGGLPGGRPLGGSAGHEGHELPAAAFGIDGTLHDLRHDLDARRGHAVAPEKYLRASTCSRPARAAVARAGFIQEPFQLSGEITNA